MRSISHFVASVIGACLFAAPATAQEQAAFSSSDSGLSSAETTWHLRAALNVAALACRGPDGDDTVLLYNAMLRNAQAPLADAAAGSESAYKVRFAGHWQNAQDTAMTRLYNFFARHEGHEQFCATAHDVLREAMTVEPSSFAAFAAIALPRLQAPFADAPTMIAPYASAAPATQVAAMGDEVVGGATPSRVALAYNGPQ